MVARLSRALSVLPAGGVLALHESARDFTDEIGIAMDVARPASYRRRGVAARQRISARPRCVGGPARVSQSHESNLPYDAVASVAARSSRGSWRWPAWPLPSTLARMMSSPCQSSVYRSKANRPLLDVLLESLRTAVGVGCGAVGTPGSFSERRDVWSGHLRWLRRPADGIPRSWSRTSSGASSSLSQSPSISPSCRTSSSTWPAPPRRRRGLRHIRCRVGGRRSQYRIWPSGASASACSAATGVEAKE